MVESLRIITREIDPATEAMSVVDMLSVNVKGYSFKGDRDKAKIRKRVLSDVERYIDMILDGSADTITIEKE